MRRTGLDWAHSLYREPQALAALSDRWASFAASLLGTAAAETDGPGDAKSASHEKALRQLLESGIEQLAVS